MPLILALVFILQGCGKTDDASDSQVQKAQAYYGTVGSFTVRAKILANLGKSTLEYELDYAYNKEQNDKLMLTAPQAVAGIVAVIAGKNTSELTLQYEGTELDAALPDRPGLTPADVTSYLLCTLRDDVPVSWWTEKAVDKKLLVMRYETEDDEGTVAKQVWLDAQTNALVSAEVYTDDTLRLTCYYSGFMLSDAAS